MIIAYTKKQWRYPSTNPTVIESELVYMKECWGATRSLGARFWEARQIYKTGIVPQKFEGSIWPGEIDGIRIISQESQQVIKGYDEAIAKLQAERMSYLKDNFRTWQIPTQKDCIELREGKSQDAAKVDAIHSNQSESVSVKSAQAERKMVQGFNKALRGKI